MAMTGKKSKTTGQETGTAGMSEPASDEETVELESEKQKVLTALSPILYLARQYKAGEPLPVNNPEMVEAWIAAGSAEWRKPEMERFQFP